MKWLLILLFPICSFAQGNAVDPAFAKAEIATNNTFSENVFLITPQSTVEDLDKIEKAIAARFPQSLVKFSKTVILSDAYLS